MNVRARVLASASVVVLGAAQLFGGPQAARPIQQRRLAAAPAAPCLVGDVNGDGTVTIADVYYLDNYLNAGGPSPVTFCSGDLNGDGVINATDLNLLTSIVNAPCLKGDVNADGTVNVFDVYYLDNYLNAGGPAPVAFCTGDMNSDGVINVVDLELLSVFTNSCLKGDVNGDGQVSVNDAYYLDNYLNAGGPPPVTFCSGDLNADGVIDSVDLGLLWTRVGITPTPTFTPTPTATPVPCLKGDVNGDGTVNVLDTYYLDNYLNHGGPPPVSSCAADVNSDGVINKSDLNALQKLFPIPTPTPTPTPTPGCTKGDVNGDGLVSAADYFYLANYLNAGGPAPISTCAADLNGDGVVNDKDLRLLKKLTGVR